MITLKTLPQATAQEVFDQVATHLLKQNAQSRDGQKGLCAYLNQSGLKCAAGCLIGDDEYNPDFEDQSWGTLIGEGLVPDTHRNLITTLQRLHDHFGPEDWLEELTQIAIKRKLSTKVLEEFKC